MCSSYMIGIWPEKLLRLWKMIVEKIFQRRGAVQQEHIDSCSKVQSADKCDLSQPKVKKKH